jgi:hypothetical protein
VSFERSGCSSRARCKINRLGELDANRASGSGESTGPTHDRGHERDVRAIGWDDFILSTSRCSRQLVSIRGGEVDGARARSSRRIHPILGRCGEPTEVGRSTRLQLIAELAALDSNRAKLTPMRWQNSIGDMQGPRKARGVPHERVVQWLRTWGTPRFRQWPGQ